MLLPLNPFTRCASKLIICSVVQLSTSLSAKACQQCPMSLHWTASRSWFTCFCSRHACNQSSRIYGSATTVSAVACLVLACCYSLFLSSTAIVALLSSAYRVIPLLSLSITAVVAVLNFAYGAVLALVVSPRVCCMPCTPLAIVKYLQMSCMLCTPHPQSFLQRFIRHILADPDNATLFDQWCALGFAVLFFVFGFAVLRWGHVKVEIFHVRN